MKPRDAKTSKQMCSLETDNCDTMAGWILLDYGFVIIHAQRSGEDSEGRLRLPRAQFNKLIDWYNKDQRCLKK